MSLKNISKWIIIDLENLDLQIEATKSQTATLESLRLSSIDKGFAIWATLSDQAKLIVEGENPEVAELLNNWVVEPIVEAI